MTGVNIEYDRHGRTFQFTCLCGWNGSTAELFRATAPLGEHLRNCQGVQPDSPTPYSPDKYQNRTVTYPKAEDPPPPIRKAKAKAKATPKPKRRIPTGVPRNKVDPEKVREIRSRIANGELQNDVARAFGINPATVYAIKHRITWDHVE